MLGLIPADSSRLDYHHIGNYHMGAHGMYLIGELYPGRTVGNSDYSSFRDSKQVSWACETPKHAISTSSYDRKCSFGMNAFIGDTVSLIYSSFEGTLKIQVNGENIGPADGLAFKNLPNNNYRFGASLLTS